MFTFWRHLSLLKAFIKRDLEERLAGSILGPLLLFLQPLSQILIFVFLFEYIFKVKIHLSGGQQEDFMRFFLVGFVPWSIHQEALVRGATVLLVQGHLLKKVLFPAEILPLSVVSSTYLLGGPAFLALAGLLFFLGGLSAKVLLFPLFYLLQFSFSLGGAFFLAALLVYLRDLQAFLSIILSVWFYFTPILYSLQMLPSFLKPFVLANPFTYFVRLWQAIFLGFPCYKEDILLVFLSSGVTLLAGWWFFRRCREGFTDIL